MLSYVSSKLTSHFDSGCESNLKDILTRAATINLFHYRFTYKLLFSINRLNVLKISEMAREMPLTTFPDRILSDQQSQTERYSVYYHRRPNMHILKLKLVMLWSFCFKKTLIEYSIYCRFMLSSSTAFMLWPCDWLSLGTKWTKLVFCRTGSSLKCRWIMLNDVSVDRWHLEGKCVSKGAFWHKYLHV